MSKSFGDGTSATNDVHKHLRSTGLDASADALSSDDGSSLGINNLSQNTLFGGAGYMVNYTVPGSIGVGSGGDAAGQGNNPIAAPNSEGGPVGNPSYTMFDVTSASGSGMSMVLEFVTADNPTASFEQSIETAAQLIVNVIQDPITIYETVGYGEVGGEALNNGSAAAAPTSGLYESYSAVSSALNARGALGASSLPSGSSIQGQSQVAVWSAEAKALGFENANSNAVDGEAGFATDISSSLLVGVALHELTHAMGRSPDPGNGQPDIWDLDRFTSAGVRLFGDGQPTAPASYFSINGGVTSLAPYGETSDPSDFLQEYANDPFDEFYTGSTPQKLSALDLEELNALGFAVSTTPTVFVSNRSPWAGQALTASSLISGTTDPFGNAIVKYNFWNGGGGGGYFILNGVRQANQVNGLTSSQLSGFYYVAGNGFATLQIQVVDTAGNVSNWNAGQFTVTPVADPGPTVNVANRSPWAGQTISNLISSATAPAALSITEYDFWNGGGGGGQLVLNGVVQAANTDIYLTPAQAAQINYVAGNGFGTVWIRAEDSLGTWSAWNNGMFTISPVADPGPTVTVQNLAEPANKTMQLAPTTALFSASTPAGLQIVEYDVWSGGGGGEEFKLNGVVQKNNSDIYVTAGQLSNLTYVTGTGGMVWIRAEDNLGNWSAWGNGFLVSPTGQALPADAQVDTNNSPITVANGGMADIPSSFTSTVNFAGSSGTLEIDNARSFAGTVAGMTGQDTIDLTNVNFASVNSPAYSGTNLGGRLTVSDGANTANIALLGNYLASTFAASNDGNGGTLIVASQQNTVVNQVTLTQPQHA